MRSLLTYILLIAVLLPSISPWGTIACYHLNKDYIARVLCENRSKPELHCDGTCYLAKRLKSQQDKQDKETTERVQQTAPIQLFYETHFSFDFMREIAHPYRQVFAYLIPSYLSPSSGFFRPPCA